MREGIKSSKAIEPEATSGEPGYFDARKGEVRYLDTATKTPHTNAIYIIF